MTDSQEILTLVLGRNGCGKSTKVAQIISAFVKAGGRALIVMPDDMEWNKIPYIDVTNSEFMSQFKGVRKTIFLKGETLENIRDHYSHGLLVFDDCRSYLNASVEMELHYLLIRRRQRHINTIAVAHGFTEVIPKLFTFANNIILFGTSDRIEKRKDCIKDFDRMQAAKKRIDAKSLTNRFYSEIIPQ